MGEQGRIAQGSSALPSGLQSLNSLTLPLLFCRLCHGLGPHHLVADVRDPPAESPRGGLGALRCCELADSLHPDPVLPPGRGGYCPGRVTISPSSDLLCTNSCLLSVPLPRKPSASRCPSYSSLSSAPGTSYSQAAVFQKPKAGPWNRSRPSSGLAGGRS